MDLIALVVEVVVGGSLIVFVVCCWEAYLVVVRVDFRTMTALAVLEAVLRSMIVGACLACSAGSWAGIRVARWRTACCHSLLHSERLNQRHRRLEEVSSPGMRSVLGQLVLRDCMPSAQVDVIAAVAVLVVERWLILQTVPILVVPGMNVPKQCFLLEDESVSLLQSFPAVGLQDSWSRDVQPGLLWKKRVHGVCPAFPTA